jgi:hypothetical protein
MSNTVLQVKRSATTAIPASLENGELAYSGNGTSNSLFIGHPDGSTGVIRIAGGKYPYLHQTSVGALTANAVVVVDANAFISNVYSSGLFISASIATPAANSTAALITSITPQANTTQLGASAGGSNTELVTSYAIKTYVDAKASAGSVNTAGSYTFTNVENFASNVMIVGNTSSVLSIGNTATNTVSNSTTISFVNSTATVTINATSYGGTANNSTNFDGLSLTTVQAQITGNAATAYANAVANAAALYQTTAGLSANVATLTANAATYVGNSSGTIGNITAWITGNAATAYANAVANAAALYQTTAGLSANVATLAANSATYLGNSSGTIGNVTSWITGNAATAYSNATVFASNASNINTGTIAVARLPYALNQNVQTTDSVQFNSLVLTGNLTVNGGVTVLSGNNLSITDNMLYLNNGISANITNISGNGSVVTVTAFNNFAATWSVEIVNVNPSSYNGIFTITAANSTSFQFANTNTASYVSGGTARGKSSADPDIGFAAGYNDGTYHHTGFFRDHTTGTWKVFEGYLPEPDISVYIDQTNSSFSTANFMANNVYLGNNTVYATINSTTYNGTANNATYLNGQAASYYTNASNITVGTLPYAQLPANVVIWSNTNTFTATQTFNANVSLVGNSTALITIGGNTINSTVWSGSTTYLNGQLASYYTNATNITTGTLGGVYLQPYGAGGAFVVNSTAMALTANSTVSLNITANTLSLATALVATSGGTGWGSFTAGDILYASNTTYLSKLARGTDGQVLQMQGTTLAWASLDGGTF